MKLISLFNKVRNLFPEIPEVTGEELDNEKYNVSYGNYFGLFCVEGYHPTKEEIEKMIEKVEGK